MQSFFLNLHFKDYFIAGKVFKCVFFLVCVLRYLDWIRRFTPFFWCFRWWYKIKLISVFSPNTGKCKPKTSVFGHFSRSKIIIEIQVKQLYTELSLIRLTSRNQGSFFQFFSVVDFRQLIPVLVVHRRSRN